MIFGAPHILQSDNGREFTANVITELSSLWPQVVLVNGRPRHPQSQGSVERGNASVKDALVAWMRENQTTRWTAGLPFVQWGLNHTWHAAIKMTPYEAVFGEKARMGLSATLPREFLCKITPGMMEEDYEEMVLREPVTVDEEEPLDISPAAVSHSVQHILRIR